MSAIDREALFTDETELYRSPFCAEAEDVITFRFRIAGGEEAEVFLLSGGLRQQLTEKETAGNFIRLGTKLRLGAEAFFYCFEILGEEERLYYSRLGVTGELPPQRALFSVIPGFFVPDWARGAVMYQIFPDRFCNATPSSDVLTGEYSYRERPVEHADWSSLPEKEDVGRFYGGDLPGILSKLDYLKYIGAEVLYLNPIFLSPSSHRYDVQDYEYVDPHLTGFVSDPAGEALLPEGCTDNRRAGRYLRRVFTRENLEYANAFFARFVSEVHARGMKLILDGVFNHCASFSRFMDREGIYAEEAEGVPGAFLTVSSPYRDWFRFEEGGLWPGNTEYQGWWDNFTLPKLNYEGSEELEEYILSVARKWVSPPYCADGWRLDVAADLGHSEAYNHAFFRKLRQAVKEANPDALILAEHYGDPAPWLRGAEWDSVMNYDAFMDPVSFFLTGMDKHSDSENQELRGNGRAFADTLRERLLSFPVQSLQTAMNQLSNHDHSRFLTRTNGCIGRLETRGAGAASAGVSPAVFREGAVMLFTLPGAPTVYYGDEAGLAGWTDPDSRRPFPWGKEDYSDQLFHHHLSRLRRTYRCLRTGSFLILRAEQDLLVYGRFDESSAVLTAVNHSFLERETELRAELLELREGERIERVLLTTGENCNPGVLPLTIKNGRLKLSLPAFSASVFGCLRKK